ncbi:MAG TPA: sigma 54-interacting transcriptional regulator [Flavobacteriaceae bacterium]|nr:sigma 54-interacting transcriptional regulator [Flavobacteriaceae bacterium]
MLLKDANILVIDDDEDVLTALRLLLKSMVKTVVVNKNPNTILSLLEKHHIDIVILDMNFNGLVHTGNEGIFWLNKIKEYNSKIDVVLITAYADIDLAIRSLKEGASDFLVKPWKNEKLVESVQHVLKKRQNVKLQNIQTGKGQKIIGESDVMQDVFLKIDKVSPTDANILILGENGTGKDLIAQAIQERSNRKDKPFVKVDVGALTSSLFESELFGYKKGAFTGADENRIGRFEAANGGTLFLDESAISPLVNRYAF